MGEPLFGTDGIRGRAGEEPLTPATLARLGRVLAEWLKAARQAAPCDGAAAPARALIGHDGRESGETLVAALSRGLAQGGIGVDVLGLAPTPCVAYLTQATGYACGIVVSASHNPAADNGVKILGPDGAKLADSAERELEVALASAERYPSVQPRAAVRRAKRLLGDYIAWLRTEAFPQLDLRHWRVAVDCANGACSQVAPRILRAFGAEAVPLHDHPDGRNINDHCGALFPAEVARATVEGSCTIGLAVDGDGDRGLLADGHGRVLDGDALLAGLGAYLAAHQGLPRDTVVATVMSNLALEEWLARSGVRLLRVPVGDRCVAAAMREGGYRLGGEKSGHLLFGAEHGYRGDGLYTFLRAAQAMLADGIDPPSFAAGYRDYPQRLLNLPVRGRPPLERLACLQAEQRALEQELGGCGRLVVRFSGTEPVLRLMVEARTDAAVVGALERLRRAAAADGILA